MRGLEEPPTRRGRFGGSVGAALLVLLALALLVAAVPSFLAGGWPLP